MVSLYVRFEQMRKDIEKRTKREVMDNNLTMEQGNEIFELCNKISELAKAAHKSREKSAKDETDYENVSNNRKVSGSQAVGGQS